MKNKQPPEVRSATSVAAMSVTYAGPLPPPEILKQYETLHSGAVAIIFKMAQDHASHVQLLEQKQVDNDRSSLQFDSIAMTSFINQGNRGQIFAFILVLVILGIAAGLLFTGREIGGYVTLVTAVTGLAGLFVYSVKASKVPAGSLKK